MGFRSLSLSLSSAVMLFYDIAITFGDEVERIWKQRFTGATILWFLVSPLGNRRALLPVQDRDSAELASPIDTRTATFRPWATLSLSFVRKRVGHAPRASSRPALTSICTRARARSAFHDPSWSKATCQHYVLYPEVLKIFTATVVGRACLNLRVAAFPVQGTDQCPGFMQ